MATAPEMSSSPEQPDTSFARRPERETARTIFRQRWRGPARRSSRPNLEKGFDAGQDADDGPALNPQGPVNFTFQRCYGGLQFGGGHPQVVFRRRLLGRQHGLRRRFGVGDAGLS